MLLKLRTKTENWTSGPNCCFAMVTWHTKHFICIRVLWAQAKKSSITTFTQKKEIHSQQFLPVKNEPIKILITSGASCPDAIVEEVMEKILMVAGAEKNVEDMAETIA